MKSKKSFFTHKNYLFYFGTLLCLFVQTNSFAWHDYPTGAGDCSCSLWATSPDFPSGPVMNTANPFAPYIYDDYQSNFTYPATFGDWNCGRQYLFTDYTNQTISFGFSYGGVLADASGAVPSPPVLSHIIKIYNNVSGALISTSAPYNDQNTDGTDHFYTFSSSDAGEYRIEYWRNDGGTTSIPDIVGIFVLMPQIQKVWIEASPICADFTGTQDFVAWLKYEKE